MFHEKVIIFNALTIASKIRSNLSRSGSLTKANTKRYETRYYIQINR